MQRKRPDHRQVQRPAETRASTTQETRKKRLKQLIELVQLARTFEQGNQRFPCFSSKL